MLVNQNKDTYDRKTDEYIVAYIDLLGAYKRFLAQNGKIFMAFGFADAGRGELSCLLVPIPGCKKP